MHDQPVNLARPASWVLSLTIHLTIAALLVVLARAGVFAPATTQFQRGCETETVVNHVGLLTPEQEAKLTHHAAAPIPAIVEAPPSPVTPPVEPPPVAKLEAQPPVLPVTDSPEPATIQPLTLAPAPPPVAAAESAATPVKLESQSPTPGAKAPSPSGPVSVALATQKEHGAADEPQTRGTRIPSRLAAPPSVSASSAGGEVAASAQVADTAGSGGAEIGAAVRNLPHPHYPIASKRANEQGTVVLEVEVHADGSIGAVRVVEDPGHARLVEAALEALRDAVFTPAQRGGKPVDSVLRIPFKFVIRE